MFLKILLIGVIFGLLSGIPVASSSTQLIRRAPSTVKLTLAEWPSYNIREPNGPGTYAYGYEIDDPITKNIQFRDEEKLGNGSVIGSYGSVRPDGQVTITRYLADSNGYHATTQTFNQSDLKKPTIITTSSPSPASLSMPSSDNDHGFIDINQEIIPADVAQQILEQAEKNTMQNNSTIDDDDDDDDDDNGNVAEIASTFFDPVYEDLVEEDAGNNNNLLIGNNAMTEKPISTIITRLTDNQNHTIGVQFVNNYLPTNFQLIPFILPQEFLEQLQQKDQPATAFHDPLDDDSSGGGGDGGQFVNDKFHDPLDSKRKLDKFRQQLPTIRNTQKLSKQKNSIMLEKFRQIIEQQPKWLRILQQNYKPQLQTNNHQQLQPQKQSQSQRQRNKSEQRLATTTTALLQPQLQLHNFNN